MTPTGNNSIPPVFIVKTNGFTINPSDFIINATGINAILTDIIITPYDLGTKSYGVAIIPYVIHSIPTGIGTKSCGSTIKTTGIKLNTNVLVTKSTERCLFQISPDSRSELLQETGKKIVMPNGFINHLTTLTVGTTRGILHSKTENTPFNRFFIPTINVTKQIKGDVEIEVS